MKILVWFLLALGVLAAGGCDDEPADADADVDADVDADADADADEDGDADLPPPETIEDLPIGEQVTLAGLSAPVDAVRDDRGMWHIYAADEHDGYRVEGFLMARDRMGQMDAFRRAATGRTGELASSLFPSLLDDDAEARFMGYARVGQQVIDAMPADEVAIIQAFADGVTAHIQELRDGTRSLPRGVATAIPVSIMSDWSLIDTAALIRLETAALSHDGEADLDRSLMLEAYQAAFPADDPDPRIAARAGAYHDLVPYAPAEPVWVREGFNNEGDDTGSRAKAPPPLDGAARRAPSPSQASLESLRGARRFLDRLEAGFARRFGDETRGSNAWAVHGSKTATGNPMLASDPHLSLTSPPLWWHFHLNTVRAGGDVDAAGLSLAGAPGVVLGFTQDVAWGSTVHGFDVTDLYLEEITPGDPDTVLFNGAQVPIETVTETIRTDVGGEVSVTFELVPHHGLIIPGSRSEDGTRAVSLRWTGNEPTDEMRAYLELARAQNIDEARDALDFFEVGGQNFVMLSRDGDIFWTTQCRLPERDPRALTYDPATQTGASPGHVLPGTGEFEWTGNLSDRYLPHDLNPARGFVATANADAVGVTGDGDPHNDAHYLGIDFDHGYRIWQITERLTELTERGGVTFEEMQALQSSAVSPLGRRLTAALVAELDRAEAERDAPGTHPDLADAVADVGADGMARVLEARDRLAAWTFDTPAAVEGAPTAAEIADSAATTIFNAMIGRLMDATFGDELDLMGERPSIAIRTLHWALLEPERLRTYDADLGDTVLWDDLGTAEVESRGDRVLRALDETLAWLEERFATAEMDEWRWGELHTLRLDSLIPAIGRDYTSIPTPDDPEFPDGFPRHGDRFTIDVSNFSVWATEDFAYGSGPQQRFVIEMTPEGPVVENALPGGQVLDDQDPHHADEMELWRRNDPQPIRFTEADVVANAELRIHLAP